ncbi:MAG: hypothetical protein V4495_19915 [Pseudomonadota bacterium]
MSHLPKNDPRTKVKALENALLEDLNEISDTDLSKDMFEDGLDTAEIANSMRTSALNIIVQERRKKLELARAAIQSQTHIDNSVIIRPSIESIKQILSDLFAAKPSLAIAFRQGKSQSDTDWISLWDDLVDIGEISRGDNEN